MKEVTWKEAVELHRQGSAILLLGNMWDHTNEAEVEIGGRLVLPSENLEKADTFYTFFSCMQDERPKYFVLD